VAEEQRVLLHLGEALGFSAVEVQILVQEVASQLERAIARAEASVG